MKDNSLSFDTFAQTVAQELVSTARKHRYVNNTDADFKSDKAYVRFMDACAYSSGIGQVVSLKLSGFLRDELDEKIADKIVEAHVLLSSESSVVPANTEGVARMNMKLAEAVRHARKTWFAQQTALAF